MRTRAPDNLLRRLHPHRRNGVLTIDLRGLDWVPPAVMVAAAAQAHRASTAGEPFALRGPSNSEPARYVARMRLGRVLTDLGAEHDLPEVRERDQHENLVELAAIDGAKAVDRLARLVYRKLQGRDPELARALHGSVGEIGENVTDHSGTIGFMAAQTLPRRNELLVAVGDAGLGMLATLSGRGATDHENAIELATHENVSRYDEPDRGAGLPTALHLIAGEAGSLYIASGTASIRHFPSTRRYLHSADGYAGTIVEARIPLDDRPRTIHNES